MPSMYPTPLPRQVWDDPLRAAEREVYAALSAGLGQDYSVFYGVAWLARDTRGAARDGEADFVVAHADRGVLLLEVKGGRVCRDAETARWTSIDRQGYVRTPSTTRSPRSGTASTRCSTSSRSTRPSATPGCRRGTGWCCLTPRIPTARSAPDGPPEITVFAEDMGRIGERVAGMFALLEYGEPGRQAAPCAAACCRR